MPDFGRWGGNGGDPSLNAIANTDSYLDALAFERPVYAGDPADAELANLMAGWRDEVRRPPARVATQRDAEIALHRALASRRRSRASMAVVGSVAAAMLCLGGFGALVYGAGPGDALYGLRVAVFGEPQVTRDDQVALAAQTEMQQVQQLIDQGNWEAAQDKLTTITSTVQTVEDPVRQQQLQDQLNNLTVKVENRDPAATVPQSAPLGPLAPISPPDVSLPGIPVPSNLPVPPNVSLPPVISLPQLPPLPSLPLPGPGVPPDISLPNLPSLPLPLPKPPVDLPKPDNPKPQVPDAPKPQVPDAPKPQVPDSPKPIELPPGPVDQPAPEPQKPIELPKPIEQPKPVEQPKPLIPEILPQPQQDAPPAQAPAPKAPGNDTQTTIFPVPGEKPGRGNGNGN